MAKFRGESRPTGGLGRLYRALWVHAEGRRQFVVLFLVLLVGAQLVRLAAPYFFGQAVNALQDSGAQDVRAAAVNIALMFGVLVAGWALHGPGRVIERIVSLRVRERFADRLYGKAVSLPMRWHESHHSGDTIQRVTKSTDALYGFSQNQFIYLQNVVGLFGPIVALFVISWQIGAMALAAYGLIALILVKFDGIMLRLACEENRREGRYLAELVDCLGNISTVLTLRLQSPTRRSVASRFAAVSEPVRSSVMINEAKWGVIDLLDNLIVVGLIVLFAWQSWSAAGVILIGSAIMVHQYAKQISGAVGQVAGNWQNLVRYQADIGYADEIEAAETRAVTTAPEIDRDWREIDIDALHFTHATKRGERRSLDGVSLTLRRGARIALVGESGSGKSTLLRVLSGLYEAEHATIAVDGVVHLGLKDLAGVGVLVPQDPEIFESTVGQNVTMGIDYGPRDVARACELASLGPVLEQLPQGMETPISERGVNLSGGQKQRLALARGILASRDASLIMLDEPTSSLDPVTEARIYTGLLSEFPDACIISSVHRLHLLSGFDTVVLMAEGRVVDAGSLPELMSRQPAFQQMWRRYVGSAAEEAVA